MWTSANPRDADATPSPRAQLLVDCIKEHGASFFDELIDASGLLRSQLEEALAELVALGLVTSDSFGGLRRSLCHRTSGGRDLTDVGGGADRHYSIDSAGRWALVRRPAAPEREQDAIDHIAHTLLARYGVGSRRLLEREAAWLPPWRELPRSFRRLESRGEIRGGRFVSGFSGEQFALPEAIGMLRATRRHADGRSMGVRVGRRSAYSVGIRTPGPRLPALAGNRLLYRDGIPTAVLITGDIQFLEFLGDAKRVDCAKTVAERSCTGATSTAAD